MHKCFKCGTQFEGAFCPECGTQWQEQKHCPQCGAVLAGSGRFCPNCGYSFAEGAKRKEVKKENKFFKWIKTHLKILIPSAIALVAVIVVLALIPTFILMSVNGTYYEYTLDEKGELKFSEDSYITLSTGKWKDNAGMSGSYSLSGKNITLKVKSMGLGDLGGDFGEFEEDLGEIEDELGDALGEEFDSLMEMKGTIENGVLVINDGLSENNYALKSHKHKYGEWQVTKEPTCADEGEERKICACKKFEAEKVEPTRHVINSDYICTVCGVQFTKGLIYKPSVNGNGYVVTGVTTTSGDIVIPDYYEGEPVTGIEMDAFKDCSEITSVTIPSTVTSTGWSVFCGCSGLTSVKIPNSVTSIVLGMFGGCSGLTSITIPNSVRSIQDQAFWGCSGLTSITIPNSVTNIGGSAFEGCSGLTSIKFEGTKTEWKAIYKNSGWNANTGDYTVECTDGKLDKDGNEIA